MSAPETATGIVGATTSACPPEKQSCPNGPKTDVKCPSDNFTSVNKEVSELLITSNASVRESVVKQLVDEKLEERKRQCLRGVVLIREFKHKINITKPENRGYAADGKVVNESYTKKQSEELKNFREHVERLESALNTAFNKAEYESLTKAIAKAEGKADKAPTEE
jgi:hypothetical protein